MDATMGYSDYNAMLEELRHDIAHMGELVQQAVDNASQALLCGDRSSGEEVLAGDDVIDRMELAIARKSIDLLTSSGTTTSDQQREVTAILKAITDLERIGDLAEEIALISRQTMAPCPPKVTQRLRKMADLVSDMVRLGLQAFASQDLSLLHRLREQEETVDVAQRWLHAEVLRHLESAPGDTKAGIALLFASHDLGRMADHATNIGEWAVYAATGSLGRLRGYRPSDFSASLLPLV